MKLHSPDYVKELAKEMRTKQTLEEETLWDKLRAKRLNGLKFYRQYPLHRYIADFYCEELNLVIEVDGGIHNEGNQKKSDSARAAFLSACGIYILRFTNKQVLLEMDNVINCIVDFQINESQHNTTKTMK